MWSEIPIPDETDLPKALEEGKLIIYYYPLKLIFIFI